MEELKIEKSEEKVEVNAEEASVKNVALAETKDLEDSASAENIENIKFSDYDISDGIVQGLQKMGYVHPTDVQRKTIEHALAKRDLIVLSKTGSGKTAAFGVPAVQLIHEKKVERCLILAPTRELAVQVETELSKIAKFHKVRTVVVYGKHSMNVEVEAIDKGFDIMVGTPGRVLDHMKQGTIDSKRFNLVVLDEADRMLDMGFIDQVDKIIGNTAKTRTTYLFSATIPEEIVNLSGKYLTNPATVELESDIKTVEQVEQYYYRVKRNEKRSRLYDILRERDPQSCIVFCNTRFEVDRVTDFLLSRGITSKSIHGANSQSLRIKFLNQFKKGAFKVLVATDVAARGLHIEDLELVINYNLPVEKDSYVHRIGRTGRAGKKGVALTMVSDGELFQLYTIEEHAGVLIEEIPLPPQAKFDRRKMREDDLYGISFREVHAYDPEVDDHGVYPPRGRKKKSSAKKAKPNPKRRKDTSAGNSEKGATSNAVKKSVNEKKTETAKPKKRTNNNRRNKKPVHKNRAKATDKVQQKHPNSAKVAQRKTAVDGVKRKPKQHENKKTVAAQTVNTESKQITKVSKPKKKGLFRKIKRVLRGDKDA